MSPRWALASYSCIFGKLDFDGDIVNSSNWRLQANADGESDESNSSIKHIYKYPQVVMPFQLHTPKNQTCSNFTHFFFIIFQTKFKQFLYSGNVVLLEFNTSMEFNENVTAACITDEPIASERETCITVGWPLNKGKFLIQFIFP